MKKISISVAGLSTMCRLCLSSGAKLLDIFRFSSKMRTSVAGVIMKCAAVQITRGDKMPNSICQSCYTQLEKIHQFLMQIEESDRTLRHYIQQLDVSDESINTECSVPTSEEPSNHNPNKDVTIKCEPLELNDEFDMDPNLNKSEPENFVQENKHNKEVCFKSESKVELIDVNLFLTTECEAGLEPTASKIVCKDLKEKEQENHITKFMEEESLKYEIKIEQMDDNLLILTGSVDDTVNASSNDDGNEINCKDTKINVGHASKNSFLHSGRKTENVRCETTKSKRTHTDKKTYKCNVCAKCFSRAFNLYEHKRIHTGEKPYQCDICNKFFSQSSSLNRHKLKHTGEKSYQCDFCNECFSQSSNLNRHKLKHTGEKPYQCDFCKKCFSRSSKLNEHKRIHTGEKPFQCDRCNKCFSRSSILNEHKRIHTGEKPFQCDRCNKCFSQSSGLNNHKLKHTGVKPK